MIQRRTIRRFGVFEVDLDARELRRDGVLLKLQDHQFEMLAALLEKPGEVVTREELVARIWRDGTFVDFEAGLNTAAKRLRDALGDTAENPRFVQTLPKRGYRFIAPVEGGEVRRDSRTSQRVWAGVAVAAAVVLAFFLWRSMAPVKITSLAVLPMANLSQSDDEEYLADGMTEAVIASLSQVRSLDKVISRTSVMQFKGTKAAAPEIARKLGVKGIVEGTVQRHGERVRVTVQLIDAVRDRHIWSRSYDRDLRDVLMLQNEIARSIADEVQAALAPEESQRLAAERTVNPEAYRLYARGRRLCELWTSEGMHKGIALLEESMAIDPQFAPSYSAACLCLIYLTQFGVSPPSSAAARAGQYALKALELDPDDPRALAAMGTVASQFEWNWETADRQFRRSVEEGPSDETARSLRSIFLAAMGRTEEALREARAAEQLAPGSSPLMSNVPWIHAHARHFEEAAAGWRSLLEVDPHADFARSELVFALNRLGRIPEAHEVYLELRKSIPPRRERGIDLWVMEHEVAAGMRAEAMKTMEYWIARRGRELVEEYDLASMCSVLGRRDEAMKWLELAYENRSSSMFLLRADPSIDALRGDPRFEAMVKRMRFP